MKALFTQRDAITPKLRALLRKLDGEGRRAALEIMGIIVRDWAVEAFTDATKRAAPWPNKKDGTPATLQLTHALIHSYRVEATPRVVEIASDRPYALTHQLGRGAIPARPMLPLIDGQLLPQVKADINAALDDYLNG
jgi:phage gpG-like protein